MPLKRIHHPVKICNDGIQTRRIQHFLPAHAPFRNIQDNSKQHFRIGWIDQRTQINAGKDFLHAKPQQLPLFGRDGGLYGGVGFVIGTRCKADQAGVILRIVACAAR